MNVDIMKALGISEAGTVLFQPEIDAVVAQLIDYRNPLRQNLPRKPGSGDAYYANRRVAGTTPAQFVNDRETVQDSEGTYTQTSFPYRTILAKGRITRKLIANGRSLLDILAEEMEAKANDYRDYEEWALIHASVGVDARQYEGLNRLIPLSQIVPVLDTGIGSITHDIMDQAFDRSTGRPDMIVCSRRTRRRLNTIMSGVLRTMPTVTVRGGMKVTSWYDTPIYENTRIVDTELCTGATVSAQTGGTTSSMYLIDTGDCWIDELTPITVEPLAKTTSQYTEFDIYSDTVLVLKNYMTCTRVTGIL